ncbi:Nek protein kinase, partial [Globisporangium splendens]
MQKYDEIKCIGRGSYGTAHLVTLRGTNEKYVVKKIPTELLTEKEKAQSFREVELLAKLKHPNVVEYRENFVENCVIHIVMAYCDGGDLAEKIRERVNRLEQCSNESDKQNAYFDIGQILDWFVQMAMAIKYLHQQRILHRDLKTSNIFLTTENVIKLGDFGIAKTLDSTMDQAKTVVGTPYYMSPEVCENKPYSYSSDVWSLGCVLYELCALKHAFDAPNIISLIFTIVRKEFAPVPPHFDHNISDLLKKLLDKSPENRPSMDQIFTIPYIRNHMQGLVASGGSLRVNSVARRPLGAPRRRVHANNTMRRGSIDSGRRRPRNVATSQSTSPSQWIPIVPLEEDNYQVEREDDLELLDASLLEESQLDLRPPERSRTPEPLVFTPSDDSKSTSIQPNASKQQPRAAYNTAPAHAWAELEEDKVTSSPLPQKMESEHDDVEEDMDSRFQAEAEELMNPNFQNEYSEECMDSLQIYYGSNKKSKAKSGRREAAASRNARFPTRSSSRQTNPPDDSYDDGEEQRASDFEHDGNRVLLRSKLAFGESQDGPVVAAYEQWGRSAAHDGAALHLEDASYDEEDADADGCDDNVGMRESALSLTESGILRQLEWEAESSYEDGSGDDDYTSLSEYETEENFYSDDSDFYAEENDTQYSDDFEDGDADVIEYANDEFAADDDGDDAFNPGLHPPALARVGYAPTLSLSPTGKKAQKPPTEVQWVIRNAAQSLLQSHDDLTVA